MVQKLNQLLDSTVSTAQDTVKSVLNVAKENTDNVLSATSSIVKSASDNILSTTSDLVSSVRNVATKTTTNVINMVMDNKMVSTVVVGIALVIYCSKVSFKVPTVVLKLMNNSNARMIALFGVAYLATKDVALALLGTVALMLTFNKVAIYRNNKKIAKALKGSDLKKLDDSDSDSEQKSPEGSTNDIEAAPVDASEPESPKEETTETPQSEVSGYGGDDFATL
jgi:ABC-type multidrug transport system fused ATPase/permease subunit